MICRWQKSVSRPSNLPAGRDVILTLCKVNNNKKAYPSFTAPLIRITIMLHYTILTITIPFLSAQWDP